MAKKDNICSIGSCGCFCSPCWGLIIVIIGILYLLVDYGIVTWFRLSWWTTAFILLGIMMTCCKK
jgi:hypothetical protein